MEHAEVREISTLEELVALGMTAGHDLIIGQPWTWLEAFARCEMSVEVYDANRE